MILSSAACPEFIEEAAGWESIVEWRLPIADWEKRVPTIGNKLDQVLATAIARGRDRAFLIEDF